MKKLLFPLLLIAAIGCKKEVLHPQNSHKGDKVKLNGFNPKTSFIPYNCCSCPCTIDSAYLIAATPYNWFYNLHDLNDSTLTHVIDYQLKPF